MSHMRLWSAAGIIAAIVLVGFILSVPHAKEVATAPGQSSTTTTAPLVTLHDTYRKGVHTITGSLVTPNACSHVNATASLVGESTNTANIQIAITFSVDDTVCLQVPTLATFTTGVAAPAALPLIATVNGALATTTLK